MKRILGNVLGYVTVGVVCLFMIIIVAVLLGYLCWLVFFIWAHVFAFFI